MDIGLYNDFVRLAQDQYLHWDRLRFKAAAKGLNAQLAWNLVALERRLKLRPLSLKSIEHQPLCYWLTDAVQRELMLIDQQLAGRIGQSTHDAIQRGQRESYIVNSFMEEAIASSMLEGAATTRREAKDMLRQGRRPRDTGEQMVANNYQAIQFIREHLHTPLSDDFVLEIQTILAQDTMEADLIGRFRAASDDVAVVDDRDGEVMHRPPPADQLRSRLQSLYRFANSTLHEGKDFVHPVVRAIAVHFQFAYEHPFCDGNGRTARALFYWSMLRSGYWLFEYLPISRLIYQAPVKYGKAFLYTETDNFDFGYFLTYHLRIIAKARRELENYLTEAQHNREQAERTFGRDDRLNARQRLLLQQLHQGQDRVMSIAQHKREQHIAYPTARKDLQQLEAFGYLRGTKVGKKFVYRLLDRK